MHHNMMHLISKPIFDTESIGFLQRYIGQFISFRLRSSAVGLGLPEFSKKQETRGTEKAGDMFRAFSVLDFSLSP
jgi:hypothetical protein